MKNLHHSVLSAVLAAVAVFGASFTSTAAVAQANNVALSSEVMVEKTETTAQGTERTVLKAPKDTIVTPGDKLIFTLKYTNGGAAPAANFVATNPLPSAVQFTSVAEDWADVSVDGGKTFGKLATLKVTVPASADAPAGVRAAVPEDVTTIRWAFATPIAAGAKGTLSYRGVVK